jgi:hypothetical protein
MRSPPDKGSGGRSPPDTNPYQGDQLDQDLDLALQHKASVEPVIDIPGWRALAAWLGADR